MSKPYFGPSRVGWLGTLLLWVLNSTISGLIVWIPILALHLTLILTQTYGLPIIWGYDIGGLILFFSIYATVQLIAFVICRTLIWKNRTQI